MIACPIKSMTSGSLKCCGVSVIVISATSIITCLMIDSICEVSYLMAGGLFVTSLMILKSMQVSKNLEDSVSLLQTENQSLKTINESFEIINKDLSQNNLQLEKIKKGLEHDIEILSDSIKAVGESTDDFMDKLKINYENLKLENDRHHNLNRQQGKFQLMQLFKHFDSNQDFRLDEEELEQNKIYFKTIFPDFDFNLLNSQVTFQSLVNVLLP